MKPSQPRPPASDAQNQTHPEPEGGRENPRKRAQRQSEGKGQDNKQTSSSLCCNRSTDGAEGLVQTRPAKTETQTLTHCCTRGPSAEIHALSSHVSCLHLHSLLLLSSRTGKLKYTEVYFSKVKLISDHDTEVDTKTHWELRWIWKTTAGLYDSDLSKEEIAKIRIHWALWGTVAYTKILWDYLK